MICKYCFKSLRKCKNIDILNRDFHFKCENKEFKKKYDEELKNFIECLKNIILEKNIILLK
jgi:hypothetical protein